MMQTVPGSGRRIPGGPPDPGLLAASLPGYQATAGKRPDRAVRDMLPGHPLARHIDDFLADLANANGPVPGEQRSDAMQAGQSDPSWMLRGPMTGPEHYAEAERLLALADRLTRGVT